MGAALDRGKPIPLYYQLEQILRERMDSGELGPGSSFPTEVQLMEEYQVSRLTVRQALASLVREGRLIRQAGKGTVVASERKVEASFTLTSFTEDIRRNGARPGARVLSADLLSPAPPEAAERLGLPDGDAVLRLERVRTIDGEPAGWHECFLNPKVLPGLSVEDLRQDGYSLYELLKTKCGLELGLAEETLEAEAADGHLARLLQIPQGSPLLVLWRLTYDIRNRPVEYVRMAYRGDRYKYSIRFSRS